MEARRGKVTASRIADMLARTNSGWGASRKNYEAQLIAERLTGTTDESYTSGPMQRGNEIEPQALDSYAFLQDVEIERVGFIIHPTIPDAGASPDGLIGKDGMVQIKCPNTATHIATLLGKSIPGKYIKQVQFEIACAERQWSDWVSFDPRMPDEMQMYVERIERDDKVIEEMEAEVRKFLIELSGKVSKLRELYEGK